MRTRQHGLSLIELLISLTLGIVLMTGVAQMFLTSQETYTTQRAMSRIQESGRMAMDFLSTDIRMAGYRGCMNLMSELFNGLEEGDRTAIHEFESGDIEGYTKADVPNDYKPADIELADDSEVLVVRRASAASVPIEDDHSGNANLKATVGADGNNCLMGGQFCKGDIGLVTDCTKGVIFRAVTISNSSGKATVAHSQGGGNIDGPQNSSNDLGGNEFEAGSQIMALNTIVYFVAESDFNEEAGINSLWKQVGEEDPVELVEGVERMAVEYGLDTGAPSGVPNTYEEVGDMSATDWENVQAVRLHLLMEGMQDNATPDDQTLDFGGTAVTFTDGRLRQVFTSTIGIRSRLN